VPTYVVTIGGSTKTFQHSTLDITATVNGVDVLNAEVISLDGSYRPALGEEVIITEDGTRIFGGLVQVVEESGLGGHGVTPITCRVMAQDYSAYASRRYVTATLAGGTLKSMLTTLVTNYLATFGVSLHASQSNGPTLPDLTFTEKRLNDVLDELGARSGYVWNIDYDKELRMVEVGDVACPFDVTDGDDNAIGDITVETSREDTFANVVYIRVTGAGPATSAESFVAADGVSAAGLTTFTTKYPASQNINDAWPNLLTFDGVTQGPIGWGSGSGMAWYWDYTASPAELVYVNASGGAFPSGAQVVDVLYAIGYPFTVSASNFGSVSTVGEVEVLLDLAEAVTIEAAQDIADAELARRLATQRTVRYATKRVDAAPGQTQTITIADRDIDNDFLITEVKTVNTVGSSLWRYITAIESAAYQGSWRDTYRDWMGGSGGGGGTVQSFGVIQPNRLTLEEEIVSVGATNSGGQILSGRHAYALTGATTLTYNALDYAMDVTSAASAPSLVGITGMSDGQSALLINSSGTTWSIIHDSGLAASAAWRIYCPNSLDVVMRPNACSLIWYDGTADRVRVAAVNPALTGLIVNADINASAAIAYSKLNLASSIVNADVSGSAAIAWSKISKSGAVMSDISNYAEGTWTPALQFGGAATGMTYTTQSGTYTRVGRMWTCLCTVRLSAKGSSTGNATLTGLPATVAANPNHGAISVSYFDQFAAGVGNVNGFANGGGTLITLQSPGAGGNNNLTDASFNNTSGFVLSCVFFT